MSNLEQGCVPSKELTAQLEHDAHRAVEAEHKMSLWQSLKTYPHAAGWSILLSTAIVMEGYDTTLISNLYAYESFQRTYGVKGADGKYQLTAAWQSGLSNGALVGEILGLMLNGIIAERFGYRKSLIGALMLCIAFTFIIFFSASLPVLLVGEIFIGIPWGVFQTITTTYAAEVCPVVLRPYLTTYVNLCWVFGQLIASGVLKAMQARTDEWGYKIPFALQWMWPVPLIIGIALAPESPWWLVRKGRHEDARKALQRLTVPERDPDFNADETIAMIRSTNEMEKQWSEGVSYWDCFKGVDLRRLEIVCVTWSIQTLCGSTFMGYSTYFYEQAGLATSNSFTMSIVMYVMGAIGTVTSWLLMGKLGRRTMYLSGQATMALLLFIIGLLGLVSPNNSGAQWAIGSMLLVYTFVYDATVGPVCYSLVSELPSTRLRQKTVVLARNTYNIVGIVTNILTPRMLNPTAWNWRAKTGFFWAGSCLLCLVWTYFRLPEPKGRTYAELDLLFEQKVPARKFKTTVVDPFAAQSQSEEKISKIEHVEVAEKI
ncbi:sugar transporter, putative [Talaromyces stipitatus ATCC 10500]|uniref:Sugar transporter, putative n=1 Tax=Talaromyces stipitatus (strain ATCC 10500 / CBS 375.48 / QM 6759 / NRRL 1006) TaxID=441959 RepID=B8MJB6_TALSN|nr:sugar transporter, putative [Talaromyces stipitatus ATCC 10500]EED14705.1 sugar transporter, putative [Talaromyces stipitatus ATCC 10500]